MKKETKKPTTQWFVMLGMRRNGRIVKNEQYEPCEFIEKFFPPITVTVEDSVRWWHRISMVLPVAWRSLQRAITRDCEIGVIKMKHEMHIRIVAAIAKDAAGRKRK